MSDSSVPSYLPTDPAHPAARPAPYAGPERRKEPGVGTALATALPTVAAGAAEGAAAGAAAGSMGLKGMLWTNVGNTSAMVVVCVVFVWQTFQLNTEMRENRAIFRQEVGEVRQANDRRYDRLAERFDQMVAENRVLAAEVRRLTDTLQRQQQQGPPKPE